jgi:hypothetical protein
MRGREHDPDAGRDDEETEELERQPDPVDPLKRGPDEDETMPGADPVVPPVPPED